MNRKDEEQKDGHDRKRPAHLPNVVRHNTPVVVFVTVCAVDRAVNTFATDTMHDIMRSAWAAAGSHLVGVYVLMPDHVHLFCSPASPDTENVAQWVRYWKSLVTREVRGRFAGGACVCTPGRAAEQTLGPPVLRLDVRSGEGRASARPAERQSSLFQRDCWDTQLRRGESYHEKWEYVRNNPVRRGLAASADAWPYGGVINELVW
jgi:REP element-mobilizing transposase RayT